MDSSSSPPVLYLGDDDDDDNNIFKASSSNDMQLPRKKRKLTNANVRINPSIANWSKRQKNDHYQQQSSQNFIDSDPDPEPILLDPDEYIIEEPDPHSFRSFDWTIEARPPSPPPPPPPPLFAKRIPSNPIQTPSRVSTAPTLNVNNVAKRLVDKPDGMSVTHPNNKRIQPQRKPIAVPAPRPSTALLTQPLLKPASSFVRTNTPRGRPLKNSRTPYLQSTSSTSPVRQRPEQQILPQPQQTSRSSSAATTVTTTSSINNSTSEIPRQILNGTGLLSAFHDSKYYQCNICKFKSVTSSTLLQHLFTHMFFCEQCSFYTYSHYNLSQHIFEKHPVTEVTNDSLNPKSFDLLYVTRCSDGKFALCMDSSSTATNKVTNTDQRLIISSATFNEQQQNKPAKKKKLSNEEDNDLVLLPENHDNKQRALIHSEENEKRYRSYVLMKNRRTYSLKKPPCLHSLTLEYNVCRENTIRQMCHTQDILKRRKFLIEFHKTRLIDEVADCLRTIVNHVVNSGENSDQSSPICALPNHILGSILSIGDLNTITNSLKLTNKYAQYIEQNELYDHEHLLRESREHMYVLSSAETNHNEQSIISSLHSSMTNGDSIFTQTKITKLPVAYSNTHRYPKKNLNIEPQLNNSKTKAQKKINTTQLSPPRPPPKVVPLRPVMSKPLPNPSLPTITDRNNNSILSSNSKLSPTKTPSVIVLD